MSYALPPAVTARSREDSELRSILERATMNDRPSWAALHGAFYERLSGFLHALPLPPDRVEAVVADALIELCTSPAGVPVEGSVCSALARIAYLQGMDALRTATPAAAVPLHAPDDLLAPLSSAERALLGLVYVFGCSRDEVAAILGCSAASVLAGLKQARATMRSRHPPPARAGRACENRP